MNAIVELGYRWRDPAWFWLLLLLVPLVVRWRRGPSLPFVAPADGAPLPGSWRSRLIGLPAGLSLLALALAIAALARPVQRLPAPPERLVRDVVLCLDRSSSMAAQDLQPGRSRLAVAIDVATGLLAVRADDRFGCVSFARYPDLVCPPTLDHDAARELLGGITLVAADGPEDATGIGAAVATAAEALSRSPLPGRVIVLLTDGEENVATRDNPDQIAPLHAAQFCAQRGIRVHTIVVGRGQRTADGHLLSPDTSVVQQLAAGTGGRFFTAPDQAALQAVGRAIDAVEAMQFAEPRVVVREWFPAALALAVALLGAAHLLRRTWLQGLP